MTATATANSGARRLEVARQITAVGGLYRRAFEFKRELYPVPGGGPSVF